MYLTKAIHAFEALKSYVDVKMKTMNDEEKPSPAFYMGPSGFYLIGALIYQQDVGVDRSKEIDQCITMILCLSKMYQENYLELEDEILYGTAGYL